MRCMFPRRKMTSLDYLILCTTMCRAGVQFQLQPPSFRKNFRGKLLDYNVAVVENGTSTRQTNAVEIETCLNLGAPLTDASHLGRMRDYYVTALFTMKNVCTLLTQRLFHVSLALLPYSCVYTVLYCSNLSTASRVFLVHLAYLGYQRLSQEAKKLVEAKSGVKWRGGNQASRSRDSTSHCTKISLSFSTVKDAHTDMASITTLFTDSSITAC